MMIVNLSRRAMFVIPALILAPVTMLTSCVPKNTQADQFAEDGVKARMIRRFVELLFPIMGVKPSSFTSVAKSLLNNPSLIDPIDAAIDALNGEGWLNQNSSEQIEAMASVETQSWFTTLSIMSRAALFDLPQVWSVLNYEGPSLEFGGYKDRGFDDIDWLPQVKP